MTLFNGMLYACTFPIRYMISIYIKTYNTKSGLMAKKIYALAEDKQQKIWIGTKEGVSILNKKRDRFYCLN